MSLKKKKKFIKMYNQAGFLNNQHDNLKIKKKGKDKQRGTRKTLNYHHYYHPNHPNHHNLKDHFVNQL